MGLFSNRVDRGSLKPGDHIYTWRAGYIYAHHGIYIGDDRVIHFTRRVQEPRRRSLLDVVFVSSVSSRFYVTCPTCTCWGEGYSVVSSCLNCFLEGGDLYRFEYAVSLAVFLAARGGTCTLAVSDPPDIVIHRANYLLNTGFGCYNIFKNNCEDFAIYCKTELLVLDQSPVGHSGQIASVGGWMAPGAVGLVCRIGTDPGIRRDVVKVPVEDLRRRLR